MGVHAVVVSTTHVRVHPVHRLIAHGAAVQAAGVLPQVHDHSRAVVADLIPGVPLLNLVEQLEGFGAFLVPGIGGDQGEPDAIRFVPGLVLGGQVLQQLYFLVALSGADDEAVGFGRQRTIGRIGGVLAQEAQHLVGGFRPLRLALETAGQISHDVEPGRSPADRLGQLVEHLLGLGQLVLGGQRLGGRHNERSPVGIVAGGLDESVVGRKGVGRFGQAGVDGPGVDQPAGGPGMVRGFVGQEQVQFGGLLGLLRLLQGIA